MLAEAWHERLLQYIRELQSPSQGECLDYLSQAPLLLSIPLVFAGVIYLVFGWKMHKALVVLNAAAIGGLGGAMISHASGTHGNGVVLFSAGAGALMLGLLALPLKHGVVSLTGVVVGAILGYVAWSYAADVFDGGRLVPYAWAGALIGLVAFGMLAYVNFRLAVMIVLSVQGAMMAVAGGLSLLMLHDQARENIHWAAGHNMHLLATVAIAPAVVGFAVQHIVNAKKVKKKLGPAAA